MACQQTCLQFASSENNLIAVRSALTFHFVSYSNGETIGSVACGATNLIGDLRQGNLTKDFTSCTDWTSLATNNSATCV